MKKYETIFILDEGKSVEGGADFIETLRGVLEELGGNILETEELGNRQLAHPIKKKTKGIYWDITLELPENKVDDFKDKYRLDSTVLRLAVFCYDRPEKAHEEEV